MLPINPPSDRLGQENAALSCRGTRYHVPDFEGYLSIKSVVSGSAAWETENRRLALNEDSVLVLNDRQHCTGFESVASFSGLFRAYYGSPPGKFSKIREAQEMKI